MGPNEGKARPGELFSTRDGYLTPRDSVLEDSCPVEVAGRLLAIHSKGWIAQASQGHTVSCVT